MPRTKAIVIDKKDNVATALEQLRTGTDVVVDVQGSRKTIKLLSDIGAGHKFALKHIGAGELVIKYGEPIGQSSREIGPGEYVHIHNVVSRPRSGEAG